MTYEVSVVLCLGRLQTSSANVKLQECVFQNWHLDKLSSSVWAHIFSSLDPFMWYA